MPPKQQSRLPVTPAPRRQTPRGYVGSVYQSLTSEENRSVILSVAMFGVCHHLTPHGDRQLFEHWLMCVGCDYVFQQ